ncbi:MAG: hypothetical protein AB4063_07745 [Crocosphaera sp.]
MTQKTQKIQGTFYPLTRQLLQKLRGAKPSLTAAQWNVWAYINTIDPETETIPDMESILEKCKISRSTFYRAISRLQELDVVPEWITVNSVNQIENQVRNGLHSQLGGLTEVSTPVGFIDLLTETEIIEVKNIKDWKGALGQILIYSAYYPNHRTRIHLFGENLDKLPDIESACLAFNVSITGEEVENV